MELSAYELERLANIERNEAVLVALGVQQRYTPEEDFVALLLSCLEAKASELTPGGAAAALTHVAGGAADTWSIPTAVALAAQAL